MDDRGGTPLRAERGGPTEVCPVEVCPVEVCSIEVGSIFDLLGPIAGARLLEVGGGAGLHLSEAASRGAITWGVDPSADVLRAARSEAPDADLRLGSPSSLPFDSASFDIVCAFGEIGAALTELIRVCRPGGRLALAGSSFRCLCGSDATGLDRHGTPDYPATLLTGVAILVR